MKKKHLTFLLFFYCMALLGGAYNLFIRISRNQKISEIFPLEMSSGVYFSLAYVFILLVFSLIVVMFGIRKNIPKIYLIYPIYYIIWYMAWVVLVPLSLSLYYDSTIITLEILDKLSKYEPVFYLMDIIFPLYVIIKLYKEKNP